VSKRSIKSDLTRLDRMKDSGIDYSDIPPLGDEFFKKATVAWPPVKQQLTIRLDSDVLDWLKARGKGYQTRINRILRTAMESQPSRRPAFSQAEKRRPRGRTTAKPRRTSPQ
jgi:uncharacterized protein (DUF4415 family)